MKETFESTWYIISVLHTPRWNKSNETLENCTWFVSSEVCVDLQFENKVEIWTGRYSLYLWFLIYNTRHDYYIY